MQFSLLLLVVSVVVAYNMQLTDAKFRYFSKLQLNLGNIQSGIYAANGNIVLKAVIMHVLCRQGIRQ